MFACLVYAALVAKWRSLLGMLRHPGAHDRLVCVCVCANMCVYGCVCGLRCSASRVEGLSSNALLGPRRGLSTSLFFIGMATLFLGQLLTKHWFPAVDLDECDKYEQTDYMPFDPIFKRTEGTVTGPDGKSFKTTKGAPHIILKLVNDDDILDEVEFEVSALSL
jgi:hypothetical protein